VKLAISRTGIGLDHRNGLRHGRVGGQIAPRLRPEMIAAQHQIIIRQADLARHRPHLVGEGERRHSRIAAVLVHLIAGRFNDRDLLAIAGKLQRGTDDGRMRAAHGVDTGRSTTPVGIEDSAQR
jgi:hypothetical protein